MKKTFLLAAVAFSVLLIGSCTNEAQNAAVMVVDFEWLPMDKGAQENPEIRLTGVPQGTTRFLVSLVDLNLNGFDHGSGFADNDGSGTIARGATKGSYNGPDPPFPDMNHNYEITVRAYDEKGRVIGIGKNAKRFLHYHTEK